MTEITTSEDLKKKIRLQENYKLIVDNTMTPTICFTVDGYVQMLNKVSARKLGGTPEDFIGKSIYQLYPDMADTYMKRFCQIVESGMGQEAEDLVKFSTGNRWFLTNIQPVKNSDDEVVTIQMISVDITRRKETEEALRESRAMYRDLVETVNDIIWEVDTNGCYTYVSPRIYDILGYRPEDVMGKPFFELMSPHEASRTADFFMKAVSSLKPLISLETRAMHKDGHPVNLENSGKPFFDAQGKLLGFRGINRDITERIRAEEEKEKLQLQLQHAQKMEAIGTLAGGVAHDLNNILSGIVSYPDLLLLQLPEDSPLRGPILTMQETGQKAAAIVQDMLTLARRGVAVSEVVNLNEVILDYLKSPENDKMKSFHANVKIEVDLNDDLLHILGSPVHLSKTIMNLLSNAAEAMPQGGTIYISTENRYISKVISGYDDVTEGDYAVLKISDTGAGISPEDIERIFDPFYTKKRMGRSGTGLGMSVVWGTVRDHNGYIDVQSILGKGTTFTLCFPITRQEPNKRQASIPIENYMGNGESILVVDDVNEQRKIASAILSELQYDVTAVSSGEEAIEYLQNNPTDLLVLDMIMDPGIDGLETYKRILQFHPQQKAIIATGFSETNRVKEAEKLGVGQYIKKPYSFENIGIAVKTELENR